MIPSSDPNARRQFIPAALLALALVAGLPVAAHFEAQAPRQISYSLTCDGETRMFPQTAVKRIQVTPEGAVTITRPDAPAITSEGRGPCFVHSYIARASADRADAPTFHAAARLVEATLDDPTRRL